LCVPSPLMLAASPSSRSSSRWFTANACGSSATRYASLSLATPPDTLLCSAVAVSPIPGLWIDTVAALFVSRGSAISSLTGIDAGAQPAPLCAIPANEVAPGSVEDSGLDCSDVVVDPASGETGGEDLSPVGDDLDLGGDPGPGELGAEVEPSDAGEEADGDGTSVIGPSVPPRFGVRAAWSVGAISSWILEFVGSDLGVGFGGHT
jgi:hypothetical protein